MELVVGALRRLAPAGARALIYEERSDRLDAALAGAGANVSRWNRRALAGRPASARPPSGPFDLLFLRLPRSKAELEMSAHMMAGVGAPDARLLLYGAKDEGIGSAPGRVDDLFPTGSALAVGGHCRVWSLARAGGTAAVRPHLDDWLLTFDPEIAGIGDSWASYPGVFAHGEVDAGTRMLAEALTRAPAVERVLDFGCGTGLLGALQRSDVPEACLDLLDVDAVALAAARRNVPGAGTLLADGADDLVGPYDRIVTNPSIHDGKAETTAVVEDLLRAAPRLMTKKGSLWMVLQKRFAPEPLLAAVFRQVQVRAEDRLFRVWEGRRPIRTHGEPNDRA